MARVVPVPSWTGAAGPACRADRADGMAGPWRLDPVLTGGADLAAGVSAR